MNLLIISYWDFDNIEDILQKELEIYYRARRAINEMINKITALKVRKKLCLL